LSQRPTQEQAHTRNHCTGQAWEQVYMYVEGGVEGRGGWEGRGRGGERGERGREGGRELEEGKRGRKEAKEDEECV